MEHFPESDDFIRDRVRKRLEPRKRLQQLSMWFLLHLALFISAVATAGSRPSTLFGRFYEQSVPYYDPFAREMTTRTIQAFETYPLVIFFAFMWSFLLLVHALHVWSAYRHERLIRQETNQETARELERLRLEVELARLRRGDDEAYAEKAKRTYPLSLSDDGELLPDETERPRPSRRGHSQA